MLAAQMTQDQCQYHKRRKEAKHRLSTCSRSLTFNPPFAPVDVLEDDEDDDEPFAAKASPLLELINVA